MRIGIDIDDTIANTYEVIFAYAQKYTINELGRSAKINHKPSYNHFYIGSMHNWSDSELDIFFEKYYGEMLKLIKPITFAPEIIRKLREEKNEVIFITARWAQENCDVFGITLEWLKQNNIPYDDIILNASSKAEVATQKHIDLFIDDSFKNCKEVSNAGIKTFLIDTRTNQGLEDEDITRVYSWSDIYDKIKKLNEGR